MAKSRFQIVQAEKSKQKLRIGLEAPSGGGKTYSGLLIASGLAEKTGDDICVIDTENGSASLYAGDFDFKTIPFSPPYTPEAYVEAIDLAESQGYGIIMIDSASHEWIGDGGILSILDRSNNSATAWKELTPRHNKFVDKLLHTKAHLIITLRSKTEYEYTKDDRGKLQVNKLGMKAQQRDGLDYEMTTVLSINQDNLAKATKDRTKIFHGTSFVVTKETGYIIYDWLNSGKDDTPTEEDLAEYKQLISAYPAERQKKALKAIDGKTGTQVRSLISQIRTNQLAKRSK